MDLSYSQEEQAFRDRVREFQVQQLPADWAGFGALAENERGEFASRWRQALLANHLLAVAWPREYGGGGLSLMEQSILSEEFVGAGLPLHPYPNDLAGIALLGPTMLHWGTEEQKREFLRPTLEGTIKWAQGYSEPDAGSDLFNLRTRGEIIGDEIVINGQKTWQTSGVTANWLFALVRTNPAATGSRGISFVVLPLDQPGVEVRGIRNLTGALEFAEVFLTDAVARVDHVIGGLDNGAKVALTLLGYERGAGGLAAAQAFHIELDRLIVLARSRERHRDPLIRQRIARCWTTAHQLHCIALRVLSSGLEGSAPGPESSLTKTLTSEYRQTVTELALDILGMEALTPSGASVIEWARPQTLGFDPLASGAWVDDFLNARAGTIFGGSSEIQRNTIAERILGLKFIEESQPKAGGDRAVQPKQ